MSIEIARGDKQADSKKKRANCWQGALQATSKNTGVDYGFRGTLRLCTIGVLSSISLCFFLTLLFFSAKSSSNLASKMHFHGKQLHSALS